MQQHPVCVPLCVPEIAFASLEVRLVAPYFLEIGLADFKE